MIISVGCDHIVTDIKIKVVDYLKSKGHKVIDNGTYDHERTHYPIYGKKTAEKVINKDAELGIVICGTGVGVTVSANKVKGTRTVLARDLFTVKYARENLNANILGMGGRITGMGLMENMIDVFLETKFNATKENIEMIKKIDDLGSQSDDQFLNEHFFDEFLQKWDNGEYTD